VRELEVISCLPPVAGLVEVDGRLSSLLEARRTAGSLLTCGSSGIEATPEICDSKRRTYKSASQVSTMGACSLARGRFHPLPRVKVHRFVTVPVQPSTGVAAVFVWSWSGLVRILPGF
jgi:hypothetical protein